MVWGAYNARKNIAQITTETDTLIGKVHIVILRRPQNFVKSSPCYWLALHRTKVRWRFRKILWPSQNMWTLSPITENPYNRCQFSRRSMINSTGWLGIHRTKVKQTKKITNKPICIYRSTTLILQGPNKKIICSKTIFFATIQKIKIV